MPKSFSLVLARTHKGGIGLNGGLPWKLKSDLQHFKQVTTQGSKNVVIMGRKTFESLKGRALPQRESVVISKTLKPSQNNFLIFPSIDEALNYYDGTKAKVHVIGGKGLFEESLENPKCTEIHLTRIGKEVPCDVYFDHKFKDFEVTQTSKTYSENNINFDYQHLLRKGSKIQDQSFIDTNSEEFQYLDLIRKILDQGIKKDDRTGVGTVSIFGQTMRFSLNESFPLLTTKKTFFRGVIEELLWFIRGDTNGYHLLDKSVHIWAGNGTREYLDSIGIKREEHDLGPIYGFQWRHFGAKYTDFNQNYNGQGVDQLTQLIHMIKTQPDSRRLILSAWNPIDIPQMALPPCHVMAQFYVSNGNLSCMMYQRSCDFGLGVPFNIASYALLTCMIAQVWQVILQSSNLGRGEFIHVLGDTHIYSNHIEQLQSQIKRVPYPFPILNINLKTNIEDFQVEDFELIGYKSHDKIQMKMAV